MRRHIPRGLVGKKGAGGNIVWGDVSGRMGCEVFAVPSGKPFASLKKVTLPMFCAVPKGSPFASL